MYSRIAGTGSYLPEKVVTNFDLEKMMDTTDEWIRTRTGIERRHIAADGQTTVDLAESPRAAPSRRRASRRRKSTSSCSAPPRRISCSRTAARLLQARLGARGCPAFSVETACSGFIYALSIADKFVQGGRGEVRAGDRRRNALAHHRLDRSRYRACCSVTARAQWFSSPRPSPAS